MIRAASERAMTLEGNVTETLPVPFVFFLSWVSFVRKRQNFGVMLPESLASH